MSKIPIEKGGQDFSEYLFNDPDTEWLERKYECGEKVGRVVRELIGPG
jgi:hypothetical protein